MSKIMELATNWMVAHIRSRENLSSTLQEKRALQAEVSRVERELAALKDEKAEREKQDYAAYVNDEGFIVERDLSISPGEKLYLAPGAACSVPMTDEEKVAGFLSAPMQSRLLGEYEAWMTAIAFAEAHHKIGVKP